VRHEGYLVSGAPPGRVDAHHHVWDPGHRRQAWLETPEMAPLRRRFDLADLAAVAGAAGVRATVLVQVLPDAQETVEFLALAATCADTAVSADTATLTTSADAATRADGADPCGGPVVAGVVGWLDLTEPGVGDRIAQLRDGPGGDRLVGVRHLVQDEPDPDWLTRPDVLRGLRAVAEAGLVVDLLVRPHQLEAATRAVHAVPDGRFVLDHLGKPPVAEGLLSPWSVRVSELAATGRTAVKLSGMVTETGRGQEPVAQLRPFTAVALEVFGADRVMTGSDWPVCLLRSSYARTLAVTDALTDQLSPAELTAVRGGTATRWYGLGLPR